MNRLVLGLILVAGTHSACSAVAAPPLSTFCNPLPIPNYPLGVRARGVTNGAPLDGDALWLADHQEQFRELADPTAVWHEGTWYLYPSVDMAWVSADSGATWQHHRLNIRDIGYAPTVVEHRGRFLLMASGSPLYASDSPLGPFVALGRIQAPRVAGMPGFSDPMLFADEDGRLFLYWGCTQTGGIWGVMETKKDQWTAILDRSQSTDDLLIDYRECTPTVGTRARLVITGWPKGITPGVAEFTVFGKTVREPQE
jgi:hypothetical protein